jgi:hypothetical protein
MLKLMGQTRFPGGAGAGPDTDAGLLKITLKLASPAVRCPASDVFRRLDGGMET